MNVLFFLTPKSQIKYCTDEMSIRQVLELFQYYRYQVIPILTKNGKYVGSISEGDLLFYLKDHPFKNLDDFNKVPMKEISRSIDYLPIDFNAQIDSLISASYNQNFVPVLDDNKNFIGIVTRKSIMSYLYARGEKVFNFE